jgi:hypothetical protein
MMQMMSRLMMRPELAGWRLLAVPDRRVLTGGQYGAWGGIELKSNLMGTAEGAHRVLGMLRVGSWPGPSGSGMTFHPIPAG